VITPLWLNVPCRCGRAHRLPVHPTGKIVWACGSTRSVYTLTLLPEKFQRLMLNTPPEARLHAEGLCHIHTAGAPVDDQQRCDDCGWLLLSYRAFLRKAPGASVVYWPTGARVGRTKSFDYYLAETPLSPHRERPCFISGAVH
jgi:hypothetical protein